MATRPDYYTKEPVNDLLLALHLLETPWNGSSERFLIVTDERTLLPVSAMIKIDYYNSGYTGDCYSDTDKYLVDPALASLLVKERFVRKMKDGESGSFYLALDPNQAAYRLLPSEHWPPHANVVYEAQMQERRARACAHFVPGTHSSFSGVLQDERSSWHCTIGDDHMRTYELQFTYNLPGREWVKLNEQGVIDFGKKPETA